MGHEAASLYDCTASLKLFIVTHCTVSLSECCPQRPEVAALAAEFTPYHGPQSGGTIIQLRGSLLRDPIAFAAGGRYPCALHEYM